MSSPAAALGIRFVDETLESLPNSFLLLFFIMFQQRLQSVIHVSLSDGVGGTCP